MDRVLFAIISLWKNTEMFAAGTEASNLSEKTKDGIGIPPILSQLLVGMYGFAWEWGESSNYTPTSTSFNAKRKERGCRRKRR